MMRPVLLALGPQIDYPGSLPNTLIAQQLAGVLHTVGVPMRVLTEDGSGDWPRGADVIAGSCARPAETPAAFDVIAAIVLAGAEPATVYEALSLARAGGARKVVTLSSHGPEVEVALPPEHWHWLAIEVVAERSGLAWTHIVPSLVMGMTLSGSYPLAMPSWRELIARGEPIRRPFANAAVPYIHERDLAEVITASLRGSAWDGTRIHATGRGLSDGERIRILSEVLRREIAFEELSRGQAEEHYRAHGLDEEAIAYLLDTTAWFAAHADDSFSETEQILGRPLASYVDWAREHAGLFT